MNEVFTLRNADKFAQYQNYWDTITPQTDINIQAKETNKLYAQLLAILSKHTGQTIKKLENDCDRDYYMAAEEAKKYGLIDSVIAPKKQS